MYLSAHTYYSMRYGVLPPIALAQAAKAKGIQTLVLTDINNTSGVFDFYTACIKENIRPLLGIDFRNEQTLLYIGIAKNEEGFREMNQFLSYYSLHEKPMPPLAPCFEQVYIIYPLRNRPYQILRENEYIGIRPSQLNSLYRSDLRYLQDKLVIFSPITFASSSTFGLHKILRAIDNNMLLSKLTYNDLAHPDEIIYSPDELAKIYERYPDMIRNTEKLLDNCQTIEFTKKTKNRQTFTGSKYDDKLLLEKLAWEGFTYRYGPQEIKARNRMEKELIVIDQQGFSSYFLITWDVIRYARARGFYHVGRGSGANSIVAFCMQITDVDPMELGLYFERFINPKRTSPPDFDIDFSWKERDEVIDYMVKRYGSEFTGLLATHNTFKGRSIIREIAKTFGLPKQEIDIIANEPIATHKHHDLRDTIFKWGKKMENFPNYLSIHAGGILISDRPIYYYTPLQKMPKGFPVVHFDMHIAESIGFHKYDILSQRGLGHIREAVEIISENKGKKVDIHEVRKIMRNPQVNDLLRAGKCMGCFYIESPAMRGLLRKLQCDNYLQLVAASSIIRPGVAKSGMMKEYISRTHHPDQFEFIHETFKEHLGETYGVMVYQEDVIKISHHFGGLDLSDADVLRRLMSGKRADSEDVERIRETYFQNCAERGYTPELAQEVWRQIESFSGYSFCKAHSASYAVESYQSLFLKAHFPLEFMVAVINNFGGFYKTEYYVHEARMWGAKIHAPCVNHSNYLTNIYGDNIYLGFIHLHQLEQKIGQAIELERQTNGDFKSLGDFTNRINIGKEQLEILIRIGAFRFTGKTKQQLMWEKGGLLKPPSAKHHTEKIFDVENKEFALPAMKEVQHEQTFDEIELLGFPLSSPFDLLKTSYRGNTTAQMLINKVGQTVRMVGYYVCQKNLLTKKMQPMSFGTWLDHEGDFFDTNNFPNSLTNYPFTGKGCYLIEGKVTEEFGFASINVEKMKKLPIVSDPRYD